MYNLRKIKCLNSAACRGTMGTSVAAFCGTPKDKQRQLLLSSASQRHDGESMTEHEDQIAQYRLKLEETAALVARIRHEINNPLTGVLGQAQLLLREDLSERSRKRVQTIEDLALRLRDIVAQLREVQRPSNDGESTESYTGFTRLRQDLHVNPEKSCKSCLTKPKLFLRLLLDKDLPEAFQHLPPTRPESLAGSTNASSYSAALIYRQRRPYAGRCPGTTQRGPRSCACSR